MLGPTDAISRLADLMNTTAISTRYYTLLMQKDEKRLWPKFGRGNKASVGFRPLLNLWLAYILSNGQPPAGVRGAYEFSRLKMIGGVKRKVAPPPEGVNLLVQPFYPSHITETTHYFRDINDYWLIDLLVRLIRCAISIMLDGGKYWGYESQWPVIRVTLETDRRFMSAEVTWPSLEDYRSSETDLFVLDESSKPKSEALQPSKRTALPETQIVIRRDEIIAFAMLAMETEDSADLLRQTSEPRPASRGEEGDRPETKEVTGPASHGDPIVKSSTTSALTALAPTAPSQEQFATNRTTKQSGSGSMVRESRVRQPATRKVLHHENWAVAS